MGGTNLLAEISRGFVSGTTEITDIVTFVESSWGLGIKLLPVQKFILKALYGLPLEKGEKNIEVPDIVNEHILYKFNEDEFLRWLYAEKRCNVEVTEGKIFQELILAIGRRGTKCRDRNDFIATTVGSITFGELLNRLGAGEKIGIPTYDPETLVRSVSFDIKAEANGDVECFEVVTTRGIRETSSWNHPYLVWRDDWDKPRFIELSRLQPGDKIASSECLGVFGPGGIGLSKAALLGHFQGDGGITCSVGYTTASEVMLRDFTRLVESEFPGYVVKKKGKASFRLGYEVVKKSGRFKQNGSQKNEVKDWLRDIGCCGDKAVNKRVPDCVMKGDREETAIFLSRLFGCDGHANVEKSVQKGHGGVPKSHIGYCSASLGMANDVRHLLLKFGVHGSLSKIKAMCDGKEFDAWTTRIVDKKSLEKFASEIGIFSKEDAVLNVIAAARKRGETNGEFECVPKGVWKYIRKVMDDKGMSGADMVGEHGVGTNERLRWNYAPSRRKVSTYGMNSCDVFLKSMGISDVRWDEVEFIIPVGKRSTVDVEVPGTHIIGGDLISHNSTLASCISNYEMYKLLKRGDPSAYYGFPPFTVFSVLNVAPTDEQSGIVFDMTQNMAMRCPFMKDRSNHQTMTYFDIQTDPDIKAHGKARSSLLSLAGGCSSNALRGRNAIIVVMDEMAHFIDNNGRFSGSEVYKALTPSIASFRRDGKVICISSPYAKFGKFYERFQESFTDPEITLSFKMYSAMVNPTIPHEILKAARKRDRVSFMCEYGGEFSDTITAWIEDENEFKRCVNNSPAPGRGVHDVQYYYGIDLGFKNDGTSVSIVHKEAEKIILDYANVWYSGASDVWEVDDSIYKSCNKFAKLDLIRMNDIVAEIKELVKWFPAKEGVFDQHNGYALAELFQTEHLPQFEMESFSEGLNSEVYQLVKRLYAEQLLVLFDHPILVKEMLTLEAEKRARDKTIVRAPMRRGAHDDLSDAFCRAVWKCYKGFRERPANISTGSGGRMLPSQGGRVETQASFIVNRLKQHGNHPRGLYNIGGRRSMTMGR